MSIIHGRTSVLTSIDSPFSQSDVHIRMRSSCCLPHLTRTSTRPSRRSVSPRACSLPRLGIAHPRPQLRLEVSCQHPLPESRFISMWPGPFRQLCSPPRSPASSDLDPRASIRATRISYAASDAHRSIMSDILLPSAAESKSLHTRGDVPKRTWSAQPPAPTTVTSS